MASGGINDAGAFMQGEAICCVASSCTKAGRDSLMFDDGLGPDVDAPADRIRGRACCRGVPLPDPPARLKLSQSTII